MRRLHICLVAAAAWIAAVGLSKIATAGEWPNGPVKIIVSYSAGGSTDTVARQIADKLGPILGTTVIVENRPGAGGTLGTTVASQAKGDGQTLFLGQISSHGIAPAIYSTLKYDPVTDFAPVVRVMSIPNVMVVNKDFPAATYGEFVKAAKGRKLRFASSGVGSSIHLSGELFKALSGFDMVHVPFRGSSEAVPAVLKGDVDLMFDNAPSAIPHIKSGALRALAVTTPKRSPELPDVPTLQEVGGDGLADFSVQAWFGLFVPDDVDPAIIAKLNAAMNKVFEDDQFQKFVKSKAGAIDGGTPEELRDHVEAELAKWKRVVDSAGIPKK